VYRFVPATMSWKSQDHCQVYSSAGYGIIWWLAPRRRSLLFELEEQLVATDGYWTGKEVLTNILDSSLLVHVEVHD